MSKARLVITAVIVEGRSQTEVAQEYGLSQGWISRLVKRYRLEGEAAFGPRSRRPHTSPTRLAQSTIDLIIELRNQQFSKGLDHGPYTLAWHLQHHHGLTVSTATIHRHLQAAGLITPQPQKRPKSSYIRFAAEQPNERWQADFTHWWLADGTHVEILNWLDDHARYALSVTAHRRVTGPIVRSTFRKTCATHGIPASTLTDNGMVFTTRFSGGHGGRNHLEHELHRLGVIQINSTPGHPTTCGKVERFHQTLKKWLTAQPRAADITELQTQLDTFVEIYNRRRPHRELPSAPPRPPPTPPAPKPPPANASTPTTGSAPTASTSSENSPCATPAGYTTSASAEPTPAPASCCSSTTSTSESSTPPPANSSVNSPLTPPGTTNPATPQPAAQKRSPNPKRGFGPIPMS